MAQDFGIILFEGFEPLDFSGPVEVFGDIPDWRLRYFSKKGGLVSCRQNLSVETEPFFSAVNVPRFLIPGGMGTRVLCQDALWLKSLAVLIQSADEIFSVCTGSVLLARCGLLRDRSATSNKRSFDWVKEATKEDGVNWKSCARWVHDDRFWTSSGVSAGIDMSLAYVTQSRGKQCADAIARRMEYIVHEEPDNDPFAAC